MKYKFKHRKFHYFDAFNRLLDSLVKNGFKIECCGLIDAKPMMMTKSEKETFLTTLDKVKIAKFTV